MPIVIGTLEKVSKELVKGLDDLKRKPSRLQNYYDQPEYISFVEM